MNLPHSYVYFVRVVGIICHALITIHKLLSFYFKINTIIYSFPILILSLESRGKSYFYVVNGCWHVVLRHFILEVSDLYCRNL